MVKEQNREKILGWLQGYYFAYVAFNKSKPPFSHNLQYRSKQKLIDLRNELTKKRRSQ